MLISEFGAAICFSYPRERRKSQMVYSSRIQSTDMAEKLRQSDPVRDCAQILRKECEVFDFLLDGSFNSSEDIAKSSKHFCENRPSSWDLFFSSLIPGRSISSNISRKCDMVFQILFYLVHNGSKKTPLHVSLCQTIHDTCRSKSLIQIMNQLGFCIGYDELERIDTRLATRTIELAGESRVPVPTNIDSSAIIHAAVDNYDNEEATSSGIGGSHDTVLMLFQNPVDNNKEVESSISTIPTDFETNKRSFEHILDCQKLVKGGYFGKRAEIPNTYKVSSGYDFQKTLESADLLYKTWVMSRYVTKSGPLSLLSTASTKVPSFRAANSILEINSKLVTRMAFTPILPHPATEYDSIFTSMINFQDVLLQKSIPCGPLWSDEGVYRLAKELQLNNPDKFSNIFLGIGGFHLEKIVIACCGKYLEESGIDSVLVENEVFGPKIAISALQGSHYARGKRCMALVAEAMEHLQLATFFKERNDSDYKNVFDKCKGLQSLFESAAQNQDLIRNQWEHLEVDMSKLMTDLNKFRESCAKQSPLFAYWDKFINSIFPILRDLTTSFRQGDWKLHLSAVRRALPLCFCFDRINYKRWLSLYFEDCLALEDKFPIIYKSFMAGDFVVRHTQRKGSAVPMDQALEQAYNKPAKSCSGIVGISRQRRQYVAGISSSTRKVTSKAFFRTCVFQRRTMSMNCTMNSHQVGVKMTQNVWMLLLNM